MIQTEQTLTRIHLPNLKLFRKGKVRHVYDFDDKLLIVASDRVSAFDLILPDGIPHKGAVLTRLSKFWFHYTQDIVPNHRITMDVNQFPEETFPYQDLLRGRSMLVKKTDPIEIECVVRGYIIGSGWKDYQKKGTVCGIPLPKGLRLADKLPDPIFTPATKSHEGHDENISEEEMRYRIGDSLTEKLKAHSLQLYLKAAAYAESRGIILADTKFEFGLKEGSILLIDEALTPDSSRFWPKTGYKPGESPPSFDKQIIRDYLESIAWDKEPPIPRLPYPIIEKTSQRYLEVERLLTHAL